MKKKTKLTKIDLGSFTVSHVYVGGELFAYEARSKSGNFRLKFGLSTTLFAVFHKLYKDMNMHEYLSVLINMAYQMTMIMPDEQFLYGYVELINKLYERTTSYDKDKSEKESLKEMEAIALAQDIDELYGYSSFADNMDKLKEKEKELILKN